MKRFLPFTLCFGIAASVIAATPPPPVAPVRPVVDTYFGTKVTDNYRWMENLKDPEMQRWMKAQADYTRATLDALPGYKKLLARIHELDSSQAAHVKGVQIVGGRYYSLRTPANAQSPKLFVRDGIKGTDKLLIDPEKIPGNAKSHWSIHGYRPSPDGRHVAYNLTAGGSDDATLHILDVRTGKDLPESATRSLSMSVDGDGPYWRADNRSFFYLRGQPIKVGMPPTAKYQNARVYLHVLGRAFDADPAILGRGVAGSGIAMTPDETAVIATAAGSLYAIALISPGDDPRLRVYAAPAAAIKDGHVTWRAIAPNYADQYLIGDLIKGPRVALSGDTLYWLSYKGTPRGEILKLDLARADSKPEVVVAQGALPISAVYAGHDAIWWRVSDAGVNSIHRLRLAKGAKPETLTLPYAGSVEDVVTDDASGAVALLVGSWLRTWAWLGVDATGTVSDDGLQPAGPFDHPDGLVDEEVWVRSWDGTEVPLSIIHKKGMKLDGSNRVWLGGYGAYGIDVPPFYFSTMLAWYERGGVSAMAHVRGGGELGEAWHKAGMKATKPNTWKDFIACAQYLVDHHYTSPHLLTGFGGSAGGIMVGRAFEERPDLFAVTINEAPSADMLREESAPDGPTNIPEFGSVKTEAGFKGLYAMSPYAHVKDGVKYPAVMVKIGANDPFVPAWVGAKFAARLQAATASGKPVLLRVDYDAGHGTIGADKRQREASEADEFAFALWQTGDPAFQPKHQGTSN